MSKSLLIMLFIVTGLLVLACGKAQETNRNDNGNSNTGATVLVGVAECDTFLTTYENCVTTKVPEANRAQFRSIMTTWRTEWKKLADNPETRAGLVNACRTQIENARTQMKSYGCTF